MTQEEKLEEAKRLYKTANADQKYVLERLFPELAESEDERIRKELLDFCKNRAENYPNNPMYRNISAWIAWLEKQGEKGTIGNEREFPFSEQEWSEEDEHRAKDTIYFLDTAKKHYASTVELDACIDWLKSLIPQNRWKPSDEQMKQLGWVAEQNKDNIIGKELMTLYKDIKKLRG